MSAAKRFDAGQFNRQLTVENEFEIADGVGGFVNEYQADGSIWAHVQPVAAKPVVRADNEVNEVTHKLVFRFRTGISSDTRFKTGTRTFDVISVRDWDETRRYLECECVERT